MKFSIIMPVYNVEKYVEKTIKTIINQTYKNFELIVVNDGTKDNSVEIIKKIQKKDGRIKIYNKENGGLSSARNYGLKYATGDYVCFVDSDDYLYLNYLEILNEELTKKEVDLIFFGYSVDMVDSDENILNEIDIFEKLQEFNKNNKIYFDNISMIGYAWNKCFKRSIIENNKLMYENGTSYIEDIIFNCDFIKKCTNIRIIPDIIYHYVQRERETLGRKSYNNMLELDLRYLEKLKQILLVFNNSINRVNKTIYNTLFERIKWALNIITLDKNISRKNKIFLMKKYFIYIKNNEKKFNLYINFSKKDNFFMFLVKRKFVRIFYKINKLSFYLKKQFQNIKLKIPNDLKDKLKYYMSSSKCNELSKINKPKIFVLLSANYGNLGDVAISESQVKFLKNNFPEREIIEIHINDTYTSLKKVKKSLGQGDVVTLIGGGNISDLYEDIEKQRRFIIKKLKKYPIISFPQTIYFTNSKDGKKSKWKTINTYRKHKRLYLFAREEKTFRFLNHYFDYNRNFLCPDIVLSNSLSKSTNKYKRKYCTICIRNDKESAISKKQIDNIVKKIDNLSLMFIDTQINKNKMSNEERKKELNKLLNLFRSSKIVITDRLHGMILSAITDTPCIAIDNSNGKVAGVYERWFKGKSSINLIKPEEINKKIVDDTILLKRKYYPEIKDFEKIIEIVANEHA